MIIRASGIEFETRREKEIFLMLLSEVNISEVRPEIQMECGLMLDALTKEIKGLM